MKAVFTHTDFRIYWPPRLMALHKFLKSKNIHFEVIEIAGAGSPYSFATNETVHPIWWHCLFPELKMEEITSKNAVSDVMKILDRINPDIVFAGAIAYPSGAAAVQWATKNNKKVIIFDNAKLEDVKRSSVVNWIKKQIYSGVDAIFCPATAWKETFNYFGFSNEQLFYGLNVVDNAFWQELNTVATETLAIPANTIITVGRQINKKNFLFLLKAYQKYANKTTTPQPLVLVGNGEERSMLEEFVKNNNLKHVHFIDFQDQNTLKRLYQQASLFVLPSKYGETWGLVVNEAMASGLPVLVSNQVGCALTLVHEGVNGFTFSPDNADQLADLLSHMHNISEIEKKEMGKASSQIIDQWGHQRFCHGVEEAITYVNNKPKRKPAFLATILIKLWNGRYRPV